MKNRGLQRLLDTQFCFYSTQIPDKPGKCNESTKGNQVVVKDREGEAKLLICDKNGKMFRWKMIDGKIYCIYMCYPCDYIYFATFKATYGEG